jgi:hypothetical protein
MHSVTEGMDIYFELLDTLLRRHYYNVTTHETSMKVCIRRKMAPFFFYSRLFSTRFPILQQQPKEQLLRKCRESHSSASDRHPYHLTLLG